LCETGLDGRAKPLFLLTRKGKASKVDDALGATIGTAATALLLGQRRNPLRHHLFYELHMIVRRHAADATEGVERSVHRGPRSSDIDDAPAKPDIASVTPRMLTYRADDPVYGLAR
jgi:hypothetical protein